MPNLDPIEEVAAKLDEAQTTLRSLIAQITAANDVPIAKAKELTNRYDQIGNTARELRQWRKDNTPKATPSPTA